MKPLRHIPALLVCLLYVTSVHAVQIRRTPGSRIPEYILPTDRDNPALWASSSVLTRGAIPGYYANNDNPRTGTIEYPLVLVDFQDLHFITSNTDSLVSTYNRIFNEQDYVDNSTFQHDGVTYHGPTGSVSDYFRDQSYGQFIPKFKILGPVHLSKGYAYYGKGNDSNVKKLVQEVCDSLLASGLSGFARNGNIDQLSILYAGNGENYPDSDPNTIWPQASILSYGKNGIREIKYVCTCELFWDSDSILDGIGTFCHEFSHTLGLPDFYNTVSSSVSETDAAMGFWSLMDYGTYEDGGFSPVGYTAFEKYSLGWMDLEEIDYAGQYCLNPINIQSDPDAGIHNAYRINTGHDDQFIILENHTRTGWYKYHAAQGLMVTSVNYDNNKWVGNTVNNNNSNKCYYILPADNNYNRYSNSGDLFPYQGLDSITTLSTPRLKAGSSYPSFSIYNIRYENGLVSFYAGLDLPSNVIENHQDREILISVIDGQLSITAPIGIKVTIHDISGKTVLETTTTEPIQQIALPNGIWIVKCGNMTRKVRL